jgi:hypothetical protein
MIPLHPIPHKNMQILASYARDHGESILVRELCLCAGQNSYSRNLSTQLSQHQYEGAARRGGGCMLPPSPHHHPQSHHLPPPTPQAHPALTKNGGVL